MPKFGKSRISNSNNLTAIGTAGKGEQTKRHGTKGFYRVIFVQTMDNVTEKDVDLKLDYAREFIYTEIGIPRDFIKFQLKDQTQTMTSLDTVHYVRRGKEIMGKISIKVMRIGKRTQMYFIFQQRDYRPKDLTRKGLGGK